MATALIDADIVAYRAAAVSEDDIDWNDGFKGKTLSLQQALASAKHIVEDWTARARCKQSILCFTGNDNFRKSIFKLYKANRGGEKPELFDSVVEWLKQTYQSYAVYRLEADDIMSIFATSEFVKNAVIVSIDKDMRTVPARIFNPDKDLRPYFNKPAIADRYWMTQVLTGDHSDNYKGIPGVGPKKAEKMLANVGNNLPDLWSAVVAAYEDHNLSANDAIVQAQLSRILRAEDYNKNTLEITLWHPTKTTTLSIAPHTTSRKEESNPLSSLKAEDLISAKAMSSSTSVDTKIKGGSTTSTKPESISTTLSKGTRRKQPATRRRKQMKRKRTIAST